ncbi:MAG: Filament induced by cAMP protein, partial [Anaerolineales bacterium]|nr:Filament induced by cAMP protein [Anaerolineales bacterium]
EAELRHRARVRSTHYSTRIEGNRLTLVEAEQVIEGKAAEIRGRERDVAEVRNYWNALLRVEEWAAKKAPLTEDLIRRLHALVVKGKRARPTPYRDGQNVIRDSASGAIIYLPPEAKDVPALMAALAGWVHRAEKEGLPAPLIAALVQATGAPRACWRPSSCTGAATACMASSRSKSTMPAIWPPTTTRSPRQTRTTTTTRAAPTPT